MNSNRTHFISTATIVAGILSTCMYVYLAVNSQEYGQATLFHLLITSSVCALLCFGLWGLLYWSKQTISVVLMLVFAVIFRIIGVFGFPVLEDDMYRYLWDARMTVETGSPYLTAPAKFFDDLNIESSFITILGLINYPEIKTVYGPMCQYMFALAYLIAPGEIWALQLVFAVIDLLLILVLLRITNPNNVLLYAWCPLIIKEFAFSAHPDVLAALFLMLAVMFFLRRKFIWVGALIACAAGAKIFALILAPFLLNFAWKGWLAMLLTALLIALPFGISQAWVPAGLIAMANDWLFNAPLYFILTNWLTFDLVKLVLVLCFVLGAAIYFYIRWRNHSETIPRGDYLFAALLLVSPALNPWYLVLMLVFATIRPTLWAWAASLSIMLSYASGINLNNPSLQNYQIPNTILAIEFGVVILVAVLAWGLSDMFKPVKNQT